jgi:hypothetical protein
MVEMQGQVMVRIMIGKTESHMVKDNFETVCEARGWLKSITEALVTLVEEGLITSFETHLGVMAYEKKKK